MDRFPLADSTGQCPLALRANKFRANPMAGVFCPDRALRRWVGRTQGFTLGYPMAGFQPLGTGALQGRDVKARGEAPGWVKSPNLSSPEGAT